MRRRLDIAMSLIARPSVLFLDEPTTGLDPRSRLEMWDVIDGLVADGTTLLLTTQYLDEAERLADDIVVIDRGTVIARGTEAELKSQSGGDRVEVTLADPTALQKVGELLGPLAQPNVDETIDTAARTVTVPVVSTEHIVPSVVRTLDDAGIDVLDVVVRRPTLDDVFLQLTGHRAEDDHADEPTPDAEGAPR
jgi:ABC-2 type transport system ATP-binding protein